MRHRNLQLAGVCAIATTATYGVISVFWSTAGTTTAVYASQPNGIADCLLGEIVGFYAAELHCDSTHTGLATSDIQKGDKEDGTPRSGSMCRILVHRMPRWTT